jgi:predicted dehydrogenase
VGGCGHNDHSTSAKSRKIKDMIERGDFGKIATFEKTTAHSGGLEIKPGDWRGDPEKNPGGMLFQCGVHSLHELLYYFGRIKRVMSMMRYDVHTTQTADVAPLSSPSMSVTGGGVLFVPWLLVRSPSITGDRRAPVVYCGRPRFNSR